MYMGHELTITPHSRLIPAIVSLAQIFTIGAIRARISILRRIEEELMKRKRLGEVLQERGQISGVKSPKIIRRTERQGDPSW